MSGDAWARSRSGSNAGRGFRYQDAVAAELAVRAWRGEMRLARLVPEGLEDVSLELDGGWLHLQVKSRRAHRGTFGAAALAPAWRRLAERIATDRTARAGLVLERALPDVTDVGLEHALAGTASDDLRGAIAAAVEDVLDVEDFLSRTCLVVMPAPEEHAVRLLAERLALPPASCVAHQAILRGRLAALADENGVRSAASPAALTAGDIGRLLDDINEAIDPSALEEAVREGAVEAVDFATPIDDARFFRGVDVQTGHVVAGLPLERPETQQLVEAITSQRVALAVGPSGSGKSALIWLAAHSTRHEVRWYRVRRLSEDDVLPLVRLVKGLATSGGAVGFVVDDLGRDDRTGFDRLVEELREHPTAYVLGACREEDLFVVRSASTAVQVRPRLDEALAERIWRELRASDGTPLLGWRESYERSEGLLLEYGHLLTEGERLEQTIAVQVQRRVREQRALELDVLALVATADAFGAELEVTRLTAALDIGVLDMRAALERLADEHLVAERSGMLGGLHELRSRHVMEEVHRLPPPTLDASVARVIQLVDGGALQPFVLRVMLGRAVADDVVLDAIAARLGRDPEATALAAALHALRLVGFSRMTESWRAVLEAEFVGPTHAPMIAFLLIQEADLTLYPAPLQRAVARLRAVPSVDPRDALLVRCAPLIATALSTATSVRTAATVLAALGEVRQRVTVDAAALAGHLGRDMPLADVRLLLETAFIASPELAVALTEALGGASVLLARLECERPWVRRAHLTRDDHGRLTASAEYSYVATTVQPDPHGAVVELAYDLVALAPTAEFAVCRAVDAKGNVAGGAQPIADKRISRRGLPNRAAVSWNRARTRAAIAAVAVSSETEYQLSERDLVVRAAKLVRDAGDAWARGRRPSKELGKDVAALRAAASQLAPAPVAADDNDPLEQGELETGDVVGFIGLMVSNDLLPRLFVGDNIAPLAMALVKRLDTLDDPDHWRLIETPPLTELTALREALIYLHAASSERARRGRATAIALAHAGRGGLSAMARVSRERADRRFLRVIDDLEASLDVAGFSAGVVRRAGAFDAPWPNDDVLVLVDVPTIYHWLHHIETLLDLCRPALRDRIGFLLAPVRDGHVVACCGLKVFTHSAYPSDDVYNWPDLPLPLLDERLHRTFCMAGDGLFEASGILASLTGSKVHEEEAVALERAITRVQSANETIVELLEEHHELFAEVQAVIVDLHEQLADESAAIQRGERVERSFAGSMIDGLNGDPDDRYIAYEGISAASIEWDVDPARVYENIELANQELGGGEEGT